MLSIGLLCVACGGDPVSLPTGGDAGDPCLEHGQPGEVWCGAREPGSGIPLCVLLRSDRHCTRCGDACAFGTHCLSRVEPPSRVIIWSCR